MNLLLINHYAGSTHHGMEYRPFFLAREWVRHGHQVTVVAASYSHVRMKQPLGGRPWEEEEIDGVRYIWLRTPPYRGNGLGRVRNIFTFLARLDRYGPRLVRETRPDAVIASSTYPLDNIPAGRIARRAGAKLVHEVHDLWPLTLVELGGMPRAHPFIALLQWAEDRAYRRSDHVVSLLPDAWRYMEMRGMPREKFVYLPNGVDVRSWEAGRAIPDEHARIISGLKESGRFVLGYLGSHGLANALASFVDAAALLRHDPVTFVLIGQGPDKADLRERARKTRLENVVFLPPVPRDTVPDALARFDACYHGFHARPIYRFGVSPNKLFDYMMAARPIIQGVDVETDLIALSGAGLTIPPEDPEALAAAVRWMMALPQAERTRMGNSGKQYVRAHHDYAAIARQFLEVLS